jgi:hypothetical protein
MRSVDRLLGPMTVSIQESPTNSREAISIIQVFENYTISTTWRCGRGLSGRLRRTAVTLLSKGQLAVNLIRRISEGGKYEET